MLHEVSSNDVGGYGFVMSAKMRVKMLATLQKPFKIPPKTPKSPKWHKKVQKMSKISSFFFCKWGGEFVTLKANCFSPSK